MSRPFLNCFQQDDSFLVETVRDHHLKPPSSLPYNLSASLEVGGEHGQALYLDTVIFKGQVSGQD